MSDETKKPKAGEYWFPKSGKPYLCIAANNRGETAWRSSSGSFHLFAGDYHWKRWHHEPRCDSFDWVVPPAESWPKWYVTKIETNQHYYRVDSKEIGYCFATGRAERLERPSVLRNRSVWLEVTETEALARVGPSVTRTDTEGRDVTDLCGLHDASDTISVGNAPPGTFKITPAATVKIGEFKIGAQIPGFRGESPDDWVTQDRVPVRVGDECWWGNSDYSDERMWWWSAKAESYAIGMMRGAKHETSRNLTLSVRCRRKDLPPVKTVPGYLYVSRAAAAFDRPFNVVFCRVRIVGERYTELLPDDAGGWRIDSPES